MDSAKLNDWMQVVGIFALVASLIFVGLQIRQTYEIAIAATYQARVATSVEMIASSAANERALAAWNKPQTEGLDSLSPEEEWAGRQMALALFFVYDNIHFQYESGFMTADGWAAARVDIKGAMRVLFLRRYMNSRLEHMRPSFRAVIIEIDKELDAEE
jgi:hypothetical protein